jgi:hypothetical protein
MKRLPIISIVLAIILVSLALWFSLVPSLLQAESETPLDGPPVYLPVVFQRWPPYPDTPVLNAINNGNNDGNYTVDWEPAYLANTYDLQEDDNAAFSSPANRYSGTATFYAVSGRSPGTYYYRVRACNGYGCSAWSQPPRSTTVLPPSCSLSIENNTGGKLCYKVDGTGIGEKCFSSGTHFYGSFPAGTYHWSASARCGKASGSKYFSSGSQVHEFWCGYSSLDATTLLLSD